MKRDIGSAVRRYADFDARRIRVEARATAAVSLDAPPVLDTGAIMPATRRAEDSIREARREIVLIGGSANLPLAALTAVKLGLHLAPCSVERFPDGEVAVELEASVRGRDVFILQPTAPPVNDNLIELLAIADACRRADAARITAIVPYFGYARSDKRQGHRAPVMARVAADLLQSVGVDHVVTVDAHTPQLEGFFRVPIDDLSATLIVVPALEPSLAEGTVIVSPDIGGVRRASEYSQRLRATTAVCVKRRMSGAAVAVTEVIGAVRDHPCLIVDDMITAGGTVAECAKALQARGARSGIGVAATHGVLLPGATDRMRAAGVSAVTVTNTVEAHAPADPFVTQVDVAPLLAQAIARVRSYEPVR